MDMISRESKLKEDITTEIEKLKNLIGDIDKSSKNYDMLEKALKDSQEKYKSLVEVIPFGIIELNSEGLITNFNKQVLKMLGCTQKDLEGKYFTDVNTLEKTELTNYFNLFDYAVSGKRELPAEIEFHDKSGNSIYAEVNYHIHKNDDGVKSVYIILNNITDRKKIEDEVKYLRFNDQLTGLFNRSYFEEELKRLDTDRQLPMSIIIGDIDGLKVINDAFGNDEGDRLLKIVSGIFKKVCRREDIISRYGEDEFAILLPQTSKELALEIENRIREMCERVSKKEFPFLLSLGVSTRENKEQKFSDTIISAKDLMYRNKLITGKSTPGGVIFSLVDSLMGKGYETKEHAKRVEKMARELGMAMKLPKSKMDELSMLASLHDLGKIAIPDDILKNKEKLSSEDWEIIKNYPEIGYNIAKSSFKFSHIADYILYHHERWDGLGYPMKVKGEDIPLLSRIMAIIDSYDIMRSGRFYKKTLNKDDAIKELRNCSGKQFDPTLVEEFISVIGDKQM
ncbi:MAG: diguanylate cyclase [Actinobacteria bacterium]|nr:diguanylate cyclase [Actinomycetota bacterium]